MSSVQVEDNGGCDEAVGVEETGGTETFHGNCWTWKKSQRSLQKF